MIVAPDRAERELLTQRVRAELYAKGQLGRAAQAVTVLVEKDVGNRMRAESYQPGDKIHFRTGSPTVENIPHDSEATVLSTANKRITVRIDATQDAVTYDPAQLRTQSRESRVFQEETREIAEGERIRFTRYDKEIGVRSGDLGTVTRMGLDNSMTVTLDSGKTAEVSPAKARHIDYGYAVDGLKSTGAERVIVTGANLTQQNIQAVSLKADIALHTGSPQQEFSAAKEIASPELAQPAKQQHDFGIGS